MQWLYPWTKVSLLWIVIAVLLYGLYARRARMAGLLLRQRPQGWWRKVLLRTVYFGLLFAALFGPSLENSKEEIQVESKDIFFCVDASSSMDAMDISPSRIEKVKLELKNMLTALAGNRMGVIVFSSEAFLQCPLTQDISALNLFVDALQTNLLPRRATNLGAALNKGYEKLKKAAKKSSTPTAQALVLFSDGEDFGEETQKASRTLKQADIHLFTVGVGTVTGSKIPTGQGIRKDKNGKPILTKLERAPLEAIGDRYFEIGQHSSQSPQLITALRKIRGNIQHRSSDTQANMYRYLLFVAACLLVLDLMLPVRLFRAL